MKKSILLAVFALMLTMGYAQSTVKEVPKFTAVTMSHDTFNLEAFWQESPEKYVALEFFFNETQICQQTSPIVTQAFQQLGCNEHEVFFISINVGNDSSAVRKYMDSLNLKTPFVAGVEGYGDTLAEAFEIQSYPTFLLLGSDTLEGIEFIVTDTVEETDTTYLVYDTTYSNIIERDIWPIYSVEMIVDTLVSKYNITKHECGPSSLFDPFEKREYVFNLSPNPAHHQLRIQSKEMDGRVSYQIYDISGKVLIEQSIYVQSREEIKVNTSALQPGVYFVRLFNQEKSATQKLLIQ